MIMTTLFLMQYKHFFIWHWEVQKEVMTCNSAKFSQENDYPLKVHTWDPGIIAEYFPNLPYSNYSCCGITALTGVKFFCSRYPSSVVIFQI